MDIGVDELYFDWAIGSTGDILDFFGEVTWPKASKNGYLW
jgi:hypothetical protein